MRKLTPEEAQALHDRAWEIRKELLKKGHTVEEPGLDGGAYEMVIDECTARPGDVIGICPHCGKEIRAEDAQ